MSDHQQTDWFTGDEDSVELERKIMASSVAVPEGYTNITTLCYPDGSVWLAVCAEGLPTMRLMPTTDRTVKWIPLGEDTATRH